MFISVSSSSCAASNSHTDCSSADLYSPNYTQSLLTTCRDTHRQHKQTQTHKIVHVCLKTMGRFKNVFCKQERAENAEIPTQNFERFKGLGLLEGEDISRHTNTHSQKHYSPPFTFGLFSNNEAILWGFMSVI